MFDSNQFFVSEEDGFYPHTIGQSIRFNDDDSAGLLHTPATGGNGQKWSFSCWFKRGNINSNYHTFFRAGTSFTQAGIYIYPSGKIRVDITPSGFQTDAVFRDVSAWYHLVVEVDTTLSTASNRCKIYINGVNQNATNQGSDISQNSHTQVAKSGIAHAIGYNPYGTANFDGYMSEIHLVNGQALDADSFGEFKSGVWIPKEYTGSYGTNGFYLNFSGNIGDDSSGNGNNWTANNLASTDIVLDSPTNNFATLNPLTRYDRNAILSEGNLRASVSSSTTGAYKAGGTIGVSSNKYYFETIALDVGSNDGNEGTYGFSKTNANEYIGVNPRTYAPYNNIRFQASSSFSASLANDSVLFTGCPSGTIVGVAIDLDNNKIWISKDGVWYNSGNPATDTNPTATFTNSDDLYPYVHNLTGTSGTNTQASVCNFGQDSSFAGNKTAQGNRDANGIGDFYYAPPTGYLALCTANLPEPVFSPAEDESPQDHFNTVTYVGQTGAENITGVGFQPDFVWIKNRGTTNAHNLTDAIRGAGINLMSHSTSAEVDESAYITGFISDGFSLGLDGGNTGVNGNSYVAWNWKANGTGVTNTDGSITSTVSANVDAGFSIVSWSGTGSNATVGHGLDKAPDLVIVKNRNISSRWYTHSSALSSASSYLDLSSSDSALTASTLWNNYPQATTFDVKTNAGVNGNGNNLIAYCFHSVDGFSKVGSYTGNGSADGTFVYTGFKPAFVIVKRTDVANHWYVVDSTRDDINGVEKLLLANLSTITEGSGTERMDILSNGFKMRTSAGGLNGNGDSMIYIAFAENPFKYANAR